MKEIDLNDLAGLATILTDGVQHTTAPFEISLEYLAPDGKMLIKTWPAPTEQATELMLGGRGPTKVVCCDCSGSCAALWVLFGYCKSCMTALGGEYCCSECHKPAVPGGSCK